MTGDRLAVDLFLLAGLGSDELRDAHGAALRSAVDYAIAAEDAGFDGVWLAEHHFLTYGACPSAITLAAHVLGRTRRIMVGTAAAVLSARHPVALAEETAMLAAVAGTRFALGVGRGGPWVDLEVFGTGLARYQDGFPESLDLLLRWLSGAETVGADGDHHRFRPVRVVPRPVARPPVWVAATSAATATLAAERGLPVLLGMQASPEEHRAILDAARAAATPRAHARPGDGPGPDAGPGRDAAPGAALGVPGPAVAHLAYVADTVAEARARITATLPGRLARTAEYVRLDGSTGPGRDPHEYTQHLLDLHPVGDTALCIERLRHSAKVTGASRLLLAVEAAGSREDTLTCIHRLATEVLPALRRG
ncbi:LLM class flavin-dependent oxidoreductase [Cryptosporangium aurantiacum]|uniref:LLM class flavin-dependent oxidoreductase n=1 Tax=Cryptosporangium aurantiacum TaxID=134849 RepID=UPI001C49F873|nr:LLM class flavin-dependent oxidoreductase [Cryptosporangium aurantiacum]